MICILQWWCTDCGSIGFQIVRVNGTKKRPPEAEVRLLAIHEHTARIAVPRPGLSCMNPEGVHGKLREVET